MELTGLGVVLVTASSQQEAEIIALPIITGSQNYLNWIQETVQ